MKQLILVVVGGAVGTLARYGVDQSLPDDGGFPLATFIVNVTGSFALGTLLTWLALRGDDSGPRRDQRLLLGTGLLGGYTTYSALTVETQDLLRDDRAALALTYAGGSVLVGLAAAVAGIAVVRAVSR